MPENVEVIGYHGTSEQAAQSILKSGFLLSRNAYDWLGDGVYFWQDAPQRAWEWAIQQHGEQAVVIAARIALEDCLDLLDLQWNRILTDAYDSFVTRLKRAHLPVPRQTNGAHRLDREVINFAVGVLQAQGIAIRTIRGVFREGSPVYPNSALFDRSHVQIAVRDTALIQHVQIIKKENDNHVES